MNHRTLRSPLTLAVLACLNYAALAPAQETPDAGNETDANKQKWLEKLSKDDRAALDETLGFAPAKFTDDLKWVGGEPATWDTLIGRVVVIQSWTSASPAGKRWPQRVGTALKDTPPSDLAIVALHTPEGAAEAEEILKKQSPPGNVRVVIDATGAFCDELGVWKNPVNIVIDRNGAVRYAGLNTNGLKQAVAELAAEPFDKSKLAKPRATEKSESESQTKAPDAKFPPTTGSVRSANDIRGKRAPDFYVDKWVTTRPNAEGKVVVIDFWATWCPPCRASIPHMNQLASKFGDKVCFVGLSDEKSDNFELGLRKHNLKLRDFKYSLALDPKDTMSRVINVTGIPHCIVMSKDWIVRWQGNPTSLSAETLQKIVDADAATPAASGASAGKKRGWTQ
ncbi:MAG: TlpA family protein disulfide reductase [Phycisphaerales bacterium]|nr:TlpA family protein disulfide reductase [Phycisphaerales bacterium]MCI0675653.1 TlpA family protein disulfide reductase [Phycisphaerales bacterium]